MKLNQFLTKAFRRKVMGQGGSTTLARKLGVFDITALGVGSTLGAGIYVITGTVARNTAGPSIVLSFMVAGIASMLAGLAYAEFGSRVPRAGSAYVYSFVAVGELIAWLTGWNLILEYIIGASSVARGWSSYADALMGGWFTHNVNSHIPSWGGIQPDVFALVITLVLTMVVAVGVKESTMANNILTALNIAVIAVVIIAGAFYTNVDNWSPFVPPEFGTLGIFKGAATCFYAYIGFDVIATSAEETKNPSRNVPIGIIASLTVCAVSYMAVSAIITLMQPYNILSNSAPLAGAFNHVGVKWATVFISVGALAGLSTSLMASIFPLPRIIYAIASDGLLWPWLGAVHPWAQTPVNATAVSGLLAGILAFMLNISELAEMLSIGTLISYTMVAACVIILRFEQPNAAAAAHIAAAAAAAEEEADDAKVPLVAERGVFAETPTINGQREGVSMVTSAGRVRSNSAGGVTSGPGSMPSEGVAEWGRTGVVAAHGSGSGGTDGSSDSSYHRIDSDDEGEGKAAPGLLVGAVTPDAALLEAGAALGEREGETLRLVTPEDSLAAAAAKAKGWWESFLLTLQGRPLEGNRFRAAVTCVMLYLLCVSIVSVSIVVGVGQVWSYAMTGVFGVPAVALVFLASTIPEIPQTSLKFKCPWVPALPMVSMGINIYLLCSLSPYTWVRFAVWTVIGFAIYFFYGITNSRAAEKAAAVLAHSARSAKSAGGATALDMEDSP